MAHDEEFKNRLKKAMEDRRPPTNRSEVARYVGVSPQAIQQWGSGLTASPQQTNLKKAADFLEVSFEWLAFGRGGQSREAGSSRSAGGVIGPDKVHYDARPDADTCCRSCQAGLDTDQLEKLRRENAGLKRILAARDMEIEAMKELIGTNTLAVANHLQYNSI